MRRKKEIKPGYEEEDGLKHRREMFSKNRNANILCV